MNKAEADVTGEEFFQQMEKKAIVGRKIVQVIVVASFVFLVVDFVSAIIMGRFGIFNIVKLVLWSIVYAKLYDGRPWAKWMYIISCALGIILTVVFLVQMSEAGLFRSLTFGMVMKQPLVVAMLWISGACSAAQIAFCCLLLASKSVHEFLYRQTAG